MSKSALGNIIMLAIWVPFFASSIDAFLNITSITNKIIQLIWLVSIFCIIKLLCRSKNPPAIRRGLLFTVFLTCYGVLHLLFGHSLNAVDRIVPTSEYLIGVISSLFPVFFVYYYSTSGYITEDIIRRWSLLFIVTVLISYPNSVAHIQSSMDYEQFTNNIGYTFVHCLPFVLFWYRKPLFQYTLFFVIGIFIMNALKRGPILIWFLLFGIFILKNFSRFRKVSFKQKAILFLLPIVAVLFGYYYYNNYLSDNIGFTNRINATLAGDDSGREDIYRNIFNAFYEESNCLQYLIGHGADSTIKYFQIHAHNDWLEILLNQGVFGIILYLLFFTSLWTQIKHTPDILGENLLLNLIIMLLVTSVFSMSYMAYDASIHLLLGYAIARSSKCEYIPKNI